MRRSRWSIGVRAAGLVFAALVLQSALVADLRVGDVAPNLVLAVVVAAGVTGGPDRGVAYGFAAGLAHDLLLDSPFGMSALVLAVVGWAVGVLASLFVRPPRLWAMVLAVAGGFGSAALTTFVGNVAGVPYPADALVRIGLVEGVAAAVLVVPLSALLRRIHPQPPTEQLYGVVVP